jgi:hypothetical protein
VTSDDRIGAKSAGEMLESTGPQTKGRPRRRPWFRFIRRWSLAFWLVVSAAGIVLAVVPAAFPFKILFSSSVVSAGVAGLLSEFTFWIDRREDDYDLQVEHQRYASLESQVGQVDGLVRQSSLIVVNQMFQLGLDLYMIRFLDEGGNAEPYLLEINELAEVLKFSVPVQRFLANPYLRIRQGRPPGAQDPFAELKQAALLRYPEDAVKALMAGSSVGTIIRTAGGLVDEKYRARAAQALRDMANELYLPPAAYDNLIRAVRELEEGAYKPRYIAGYLTLFSFYLTYRMTGQYPDVVSLFESPVSLTDPATVAEIRRILAQRSGRQDGTPEPSGQPEVPDTGSAKELLYDRPPVMNTAPGRGSLELWSSFRPAGGQVRSLLRFVRKWSLVFWLAVSVAGAVIAVVPQDFAVKVLLSSALVGAGIAGVLSEFTYLPDRRRAERELKDQEKRYSDLEAHIGRVDGLLKKTDITMINQMFKLGLDLARVRSCPAEQMAGFAGEARELADFIGLARAVGKYLNNPYLRPAENSPLPDQDPTLDLIRAVMLRHKREAAAALRAGYAFGDLLAGKFSKIAIGVLKETIELLYLPPEAHDNMQRAIQELEADAYKAGKFLLYLILFSHYLKYRVTGALKEVAPLFEAPVSLTDPATVAEVHRLVEKVRSSRPALPAPRGVSAQLEGGPAQRNRDPDG